jgi:hypothetical protein
MNVMPCGLVEVNRRVGRMYFFHLQGKKLARSKQQAELDKSLHLYLGAT